MAGGEKVQDASPLPDRLLDGRRRPRSRGSRAARDGAGLGQLGDRARPGLEGPRRRQPHRARVRGPARGADGSPILALGLGFRASCWRSRCPRRRVDLIESVGRKCDFIRRAIEAAGIANARVLNARSEELATGEGREAYDAVTARAVGRLSTLAELASPLLDDGGVLVAWKGKRDPEEEAQLGRRRGGAGDGAGGDPPRRPLRRQRAPPPAPAPQGRATPPKTFRAGRAWPRSDRAAEH